MEITYSGGGHREIQEVQFYDPQRHAREAPEWAETFTYDRDLDAEGLPRFIYYIDGLACTLEEAARNNDVHLLGLMRQYRWDDGIVISRHGHFNGYRPDLMVMVELGTA